MPRPAKPVEPRRHAVDPVPTCMLRRSAPIERFDLEPEFVTLTEACQLMRVGKTTLHKLINQDLIDTEKAGKKTLVRLRSIRGYGDGAA